jgi:hypothetical protein
MEVWCGDASQTRYGLTKAKLVMSNGKVVSKKKHDDAVANKAQYLEKMNARRPRRRAAPVTIRPAGETLAISIPATTRAVPAPTPASRREALAAAVASASRTY